MSKNILKSHWLWTFLIVAPNVWHLELTNISYRYGAQHCFHSRLFLILLKVSVHKKTCWLSKPPLFIKMVPNMIISVFSPSRIFLTFLKSSLIEENMKRNISVIAFLMSGAQRVEPLPIKTTIKLDMEIKSSYFRALSGEGSPFS